MDIASLIQQATGGGADTESVGQAAEDHLNQMPADEVSDHLQTAADNANQNGQPDIAQTLEGMVANRQMDPEGLKAAAISYIRSNPQVLTHFAPSFAQGLLNRVL